MHVLGTRVPRRLGVARSASSPKAAQALGCSLTPGLQISFGRVSCMARAASVPGLWTLGFLLLCGVCVWVRVAVGCGFCSPRQSWLGSWVGVFGHGLWCCHSFAGCLWCSWLDLGFGLLMGRVWLRARSACPPSFPVQVCGVGVRARVWVPAASRFSFEGCWGVCVLVRPSRVVYCTSWLGLLCGGACLCACPACSPPFLAGVRCVGVRAGPGCRLCAALLGSVVGVCFLRCFLFFFGVSWLGFVVSVAGCPCPGPCGPCPPIPFLSGWAAGSFFFPAWCVSACFGVPFPAGPLFLAWCCGFWLGGPPVPFWGPVLGAFWVGGWAASCGVGRRFGGSGLFSRPPPFFFRGGGLPVPPSAFRGLAHALARIQCGLPGCCWRLRSAWPCSGPMGWVGYVHVGLGAPSCRVRSSLCWLGVCARRLRVALG